MTVVVNRRHMLDCLTYTTWLKETNWGTLKENDNYTMKNSDQNSTNNHVILINPPSYKESLTFDNSFELCTCDVNHIYSLTIKSTTCKRRERASLTFLKNIYSYINKYHIEIYTKKISTHCLMFLSGKQ